MGNSKLGMDFTWILCNRKSSKLYFDRFEEELQPNLPEPESPDYEGTPEDTEAAAEEVI